MATIDSVETKKGTKYRARVRLKDVVRTKTFERHADAKAWATKMESLINDGVQGNAGRNVIFADLIEKYIQEVAPSKRGAEKEIYRLNRLKKSTLANLVIDELRPVDFANWRDARLKEVSGASVRRELETISSICNVATKDWSLMRENPVLKITRPKQERPRSRRPTQDEIEKILYALHYTEDGTVEMTSQRIGVAVLFAIETAMRSGEILGLEWKDVDLVKRTAHLDITKNGSSRTVPLSKRAVELLEKLKNIHPERVFDVDDGTRDALFRRAVLSQEIKDLHFHDLRREALTRMAKKVDVMTLAKISGHKDVRILLNTYYNPDISSVADLLD